VSAQVHNVQYMAVETYYKIYSRTKKQWRAYHVFIWSLTKIIYIWLIDRLIIAEHLASNISTIFGTRSDLTIYKV